MKYTQLKELLNNPNAQIDALPIGLKLFDDVAGIPIGVSLFASRPGMGMQL